DLATPSVADAVGICGPWCADADDDATTCAVTHRLAGEWGCSIALTRGPAPITLAAGGTTQLVAVDAVTGDECGAGDWFAAATSHALAGGATLEAAVRAGRDAAAGWVASERKFAAPPPRASVVVATSGCFDMLHPGHISTLRHARSIGDRLVVLLNSDESV